MLPSALTRGACSSFSFFSASFSGFSQDPSGDLGNPSLIKAHLLGASSQVEMGFKRKLPTSLLDLIEGQPGKDAPGKSQPKLPPPLPKPQSAQTRSSSTQS